jgi:hypothetical protein
MTIDVTFIDSGREPECKPDPAYPNGKAVSLAGSTEAKVCTYNLPKAPRCGVLQIKCRKCGFTAAITVAGRPDDPAIVTLPCKTKAMN